MPVCGVQKRRACPCPVDFKSSSWTTALRSEWWQPMASPISGHMRTRSPLQDTWSTASQVTTHTPMKRSLSVSQHLATKGPARAAQLHSEGIRDGYVSSMAVDACEGYKPTWFVKSSFGKKGLVQFQLQLRVPFHSTRPAADTFQALCHVSLAKTLSSHL